MSKASSGMRALILAVAGALALALPSSASAAEDVVPEPVAGPVPQEIADKFASCPGPEAFEVADPFLCINIGVGGDLKLGHVESTIDEPITMSFALGLGFVDGDIVTEMPVAEGGPPQPIKISGGILGVPALDPIIDLTEPLGLLTLSATPQLGTVDTGEGLEDAFAVLMLLSGAFGTLEASGADINLGVPLSIQLNNTLFGNKCQIGTPDNPIDIGLTSGTSDPGEDSGWPPMTGGFGSGFGFEFSDHGNLVYIETEGTTLVDNSFVAHGPQKCDLLLGDLLDQDSGLFDPLISAQTGLPAGPGGSHAIFELSSETANYELIHE